METTRLSSKGQVIIPKSVRSAHRWEAGLDFQIIDTGDGILLRPKAPFEPTELADVAGLFKAKVPSRSDAEIKAALDQHIRKAWRDRG
jgi:AbrB family looped-hinge helix DNA binding protein